MTDLRPLSAQPKTIDPNRLIRIKRAHDYPIQLWILLACFLGLLTIYHLGALLVLSRRKRRARDRLSRRVSEKPHGGESSTWNFTRPISLRRIPFAVLNSFRIVTFRITVPIGGGNVLNGAEIGIIAGYIVALFTWEFINCMNVRTGVKFDASYWANRAACIVRSQFPLFVALAGKNNIISLLTGISYEKLNVLHRAAARVCLVLIWVHFWGRVKQGLTKDLVLSNPWVRTGVLTATAYTILVLISFRPLRTRFYEFFFFSHFLLVLIIMIGAYFHMRRGFGQHTFSEVGPYLIPTFALWALDRALRLIRILRNNRRSLKVGAHSDAMVELLSPTMVRVVLTRKMTWRAGQSVFLIMPDVSNIPFEAHPFTIASIPKRGVMSSSSSGGSSSIAREDDEEGSQDNKLLFLIRVKKGFTRRLGEAAERQGSLGHKFPFSVYVDGPYGSPPDLNAFQSVILIAGGSGISYTLPMLQQIVYDANRGKTICCNLLFIWVVPHHSSVTWIANAIWDALAASPSSLNIRLQVYVTQETSVDVTSVTEVIHGGSKPSEAVMYKLLEDNRMKVNIGRPHVHTLLQDELRSTEGHVSVDVAGPAELALDVRESLCSGAAGPLAVLKGGPDVTLHVETYGIA